MTLARCRSLALATSALSLFAGTAAAQGTPIWHTKDVFAPSTELPLIQKIAGIGVNGTHGYVARVWTTEEPLGGFLWGTDGVSAPDALSQGFTVDTVGTIGLSDAGQTFQWAAPAFAFVLDGVPVASQGDAVPGVANAVFSEPNVWSAGLTGAGEPFYVFEYEHPVTEAFVGTGLFFGMGATAPVLTTGDPLPSVAELVGNSIVDAYYTHDGAHYVAIVESSGAGARQHVVFDGDVAQVAGGFLSEGDPVPAAIGGLPGETWEEFTSVRRNDAGETVLGGRTSEGGFILKDDEIVLRSGQAIDGHTLAGTPVRVRISESSRIAWTWRYDVDSFLNEAVGLDDHFILRDGQPVDWDGDGFVDTEYAYRGVGVHIELTTDDSLYFVGLVHEIAVNFYSTSLFRADVDGLFTSEHTLSAAGDQVEFFVDAGQGRAGDGYWLLGSATGTTPGFTLGSATVPLNIDPYYFTTIRATNGAVFSNTLGVLDADGEATATFTIPAVPDAIGVQLHHAALLFDLSTLVIDDTTTAVSVVVTP